MVSDEYLTNIECFARYIVNDDLSSGFSIEFAECVLNLIAEIRKERS